MEKNKITAGLEREYKNKKIEAERRADEALGVFIDGNPDFAALEKNLRTAQIAVAKKTASAAEVEKALEARNNWLKENKINPSSLLPEYDCAKCSDSGVDGGKYCVCFLKKLNKRLSSGGAPESGNTFETSNHTKIKNKAQRERLEKIYSAAKEFCENFPDGVSKKNMALAGKTGTGKTYLLSAMVNELEERGFSVFYLTAFAFNNLLLKYHTTFDEDKSPYLESLLECDVLAIDDLGSEPIYKNVTKEYLYSIVNERNLKNKCTIYSTNLNPADIRDRYEDRIAYRLLSKEKTFVIEFTGDDLRIQKGE